MVVSTMGSAFQITQASQPSTSNKTDVTIEMLQQPFILIQSYTAVGLPLNERQLVWVIVFVNGIDQRTLASEANPYGIILRAIDKQEDGHLRIHDNQEFDV